MLARTGKEAAAQRRRSVLTVGRLAAAVILAAAGLAALHFPSLPLPYFWDEAGYFIPAAHDLLLTGDPIPRSVASNAHPPLVFAYLALVWKTVGFTPAATRTAMLLVASFALLGVFRLASRLANRQAAIAATLCAAAYPVFFAQAPLAQLDLPAAAFTVWGTVFFLEGRRLGAAAMLALAVLAKETAIFSVLALSCCDLFARRPARSCLLLLAAPLAFLTAWFAWHAARTGHAFGNPDFFAYNVSKTLSAERFVVAFALRLWHTFGHLNLLFLTVPGFLAMWRRRNSPPVAVLAVIAANVLAMSLIGGAVLARYMLPAVLLAIVLAAAALWSWPRFGKPLVALAGAAFLAAHPWYPPYHYAFEDNLAWRDFVRLHRDAARFLEEHAGDTPVSTTWPATDELTQPRLGYVTRPLAVRRDLAPLVFVFSAKHHPAEGQFSPATLLRCLPIWTQAQARYFEAAKPESPEAAARRLNGTIVWQKRRGPQFAAVIATPASAVP